MIIIWVNFDEITRITLTYDSIIRLFPEMILRVLQSIDCGTIQLHQVSLILGTHEEWCTNLGSNYRFILDTCYFFEEYRQNFNDAKKNCRDKFGSNRNGKLMEPKTMVRFRKIKELAKNIFGSGCVLTGFEKNNDAGTDVRHNSDGSRALIKPWRD